MPISEHIPKKELNMTTLLFGPKMLLRLAVVWIIFVVIGSGTFMVFIQKGIVSDFVQSGILSPSEQLAQNTNVEYIPPVQNGTAPVPIPSTNPIYTTGAKYPNRLIIPSIGTDLPVSNPNTRNIAKLDEKLKSSVVRYPDSATLGAKGGNVLIFGHSTRLPIVRNKFYQSFNKIETLKKGALIKVISGNTVYTYNVTRVYKSNANNGRIPLTVSGSRLTLLTCNSFGAKSDRWVVEAELVGSSG